MWEPSAVCQDVDGTKLRDSLAAWFSPCGGPALAAFG